MMAALQMSRCLLHIGYAKAGSSFLQRWFAAHPEFVYRHQGLHGFSRTPEISAYADATPAGPAWFVTSDEDLSFWKGPVEPVGLGMRAYDVRAHQRRVCEILGDLFPGATVLIVTRGFASVIGSAYSQYVRAGGVLTFMDFMASTADLMVDFWNYDFLVELYEKKFGKENVVVLPYERLQQNSAEFLRLLAARLGVAPHPSGVERVNPALDARSLERIRRFSFAVTRAISPLPRAAQRRLFALHTRALSGAGLPTLLGATRPGPASGSELEPPAEFLARFRGRAAVVAGAPQFADFRASYLEPPADSGATFSSSRLSAALVAAELASVSAGPRA
jgi:hypothetical protein